MTLPWQAAKSFKAARRRSTALVSTTTGSTPVLANVLNIKPLALNIAVRAARHTTCHTSSLTVWHGCSSSHTCRGSSYTETGRLCCMARLMAEAPVQVLNTCSRSCSACVARGDAAECYQPQGQAVPRFMGHSWPPAPITPCWSRRHQTSFQLFSHGSLHTWRPRARSAFVIASAVCGARFFLRLGGGG